MTLISAKDKGLKYSSLPQMGEVLPSWFQDLTFDIITKGIVDYEVTEIRKTVSTKGVRQPMSATQLSIKPEGQRAWRWETLHCLPDLKLKIDDIVIFNDIKYRVMQRWNWAEYGYMEYHLCEAYQDGTN